jgi:hypothetical protein
MISGYLEISSVAVFADISGRYSGREPLYETIVKSMIIDELKRRTRSMSADWRVIAERHHYWHYFDSPVPPRSPSRAARSWRPMIRGLRGDLMGGQIAAKFVGQQGCKRGFWREAGKLRRTLLLAYATTVIWLFSWPGSLILLGLGLCWNRAWADSRRRFRACAK